MAKLSGYEANRLLKKESKRRKGFQPVLESGVDVKTINGETIVGSGNLDVAGGGGPSAPPSWGDITGTLADQSDLVSALGGKASTSHGHAIADVSGLQAALDAKQDDLVSGTTIKTVNGESLLGAGNIIISGGGSTAAYISVTFDNGAEDVDVGAFCDVYVPYAFTISSVTLLANESGSIVVDVWKDTYGNYPPTVADKITASTPPTLSGTNKGQDSTLTGWDKTVAAGSTLRFNVNSCTGIKRCQILIEGVKG